LEGPHGRLSAAYIQEVHSLANAGQDDVAVVEHHGRLAPDYTGPAVQVEPAVVSMMHGRVTHEYSQVVADFLASA